MSNTKTVSQRLLIVTLCLAAMIASPANSQTRAVLPYKTISEDLSEQRRSVFVRIDHRLDEADLLTIAGQIQARSKRSYARTQVNFILPGMPIGQGSWASVLFAPEPKVLIHGLSRADEDIFLAEHRADRRSLLGSWLTSTPAPLGRLTIYSDHGKVFAEWRLRGGQKTVDDLIDTTVKTVRRFDVPDGGYFILTRAGELEIWDKTNLIATAERIRPEHLERATVPVAIASAPRPLAPEAHRGGAAIQGQLPSSPTQPEPTVAAAVAAASSSGALALAPPNTASGASSVLGRPTPQVATLASSPPPPSSATGETIAANAVSIAKKNPRKVTQARSKVRTVRTAAPLLSRGTTTGDEISAKLAGRF